MIKKTFVIFFFCEIEMKTNLNRALSSQAVGASADVWGMGRVLAVMADVNDDALEVTFFIIFSIYIVSIYYSRQHYNYSHQHSIIIINIINIQQHSFIISYQ